MFAYRRPSNSTTGETSPQDTGAQDFMANALQLRQQRRADVSRSHLPRNSGNEVRDHTLSGLLQ